MGDEAGAEEGALDAGGRGEASAGLEDLAERAAMSWKRREKVLAWTGGLVGDDCALVVAMAVVVV